MDINSEMKTYPQKVEVTNELNAKVDTSENPLNVNLDPNLINGSGASSSLRVTQTNTPSWVFSRPAGSNLNLHISSVHVVNSGVGTVFPIDIWVYTITASAVANNVSAVYGAYSARFPTATSIVIFYETLSSAGSVDATSYSSTD